MKKSAFVPLLIAITSLQCLPQSAFTQGVQIEKAPAADRTTPAPHPSGSPKQARPASIPTAAETLYDYIQAHHLEVARCEIGTRYLWTDRLLIEISQGPPPEPLASLLSSGPNNTSQFSTWVHDTFESQTKAWHPAKRNPAPAKQGTDELVGASPTDHCFVNPVYVSYVLARYPTASILIKGPKEPALFMVNGQVRAVVSPWTQLPDGTPLL